jgi:hypothetical protein
MSTKKTTSPHRTPVPAEYLPISWFFQPLDDEHFAHLKSDAGQPTLESLQAEIRELKKVVADMARPVG